MLTVNEIKALCEAAGVSCIDHGFYVELAGRTYRTDSYKSPIEVYNTLWYLYCSRGETPHLHSRPIR